jgi:hypothetical protein
LLQPRRAFLDPRFFRTEQRFPHGSYFRRHVPQRGVDGANLVSASALRRIAMVRHR